MIASVPTRRFTDAHHALRCGQSLLSQTSVEKKSVVYFFHFVYLRSVRVSIANDSAAALCVGYCLIRF